METVLSETLLLYMTNVRVFAKTMFCDMKKNQSMLLYFMFGLWNNLLADLAINLTVIVYCLTNKKHFMIVKA